ncbi:MAG: heavy metal translocating P-type ATPase [Gammaproteobacteria bacterium]|nr:heavy metal translocating P-type ATPase [Gammaproteobacteria bacterium]
MLLEAGVISFGLYLASKLCKKTNEEKTEGEKKELLADDTWKKQYQELSSDEDKEKKLEEERKIDQDLLVALGSTGIAILGRSNPILSLLSLPGMLYVSRPIFIETYRKLKEGKVSCATLVSLVIGGCVFSGMYITNNVVAVIYQISRKLIFRVKENSQNKLVDVFRQTPTAVWVRIDGAEVEVAFDEIKPGDAVVVSSGETVPVDGVVTQGSASIDQQILTGEATPVEKDVGDQVFASTTVISGKVDVLVECSGEETTVARIGQTLNDTIDFKSTVELKARSLADSTVSPTMILSALSLPIVGAGGAIAIINSHMKYNLDLIAPVSILNFFNIASRHGVFIKDGRTMDLLDQIDTIVFDKTGTLTDEQPEVKEIYPCSVYEENQILVFAATAEARQKHPIAKAILEAVQIRDLQILDIDEAEYQIGYGLTVSSNGKLIQVGSARFIEMNHISIPTDIEKEQHLCHEIGHSMIMVAVNGELIGAIEMAPSVRPEVKSVINLLREKHHISSTYIISGDHEGPTRELARELNIDHYFAETLPDQKAEIVSRLRDEGKFVCYIGDGINDAIAMKQAHVSVSLSGASSVATDTAQVILMDQGLNHLPFLFDLGDRFRKNMNISFGLVLMPMVVGAGGVFFLGFGVASTLALNFSGLCLGLANATTPLFITKREDT